MATTMHCPACGAAVRDGYRFCGECGSVVLRAAPETTSCPSCHRPSEPGKNFCRHCGAALAHTPFGADEEPVTEIRALPLGMPPGAPAPAAWTAHSPGPDEPVTEIRAVPLGVPAGGQAPPVWGPTSVMPSGTPGWDDRRPIPPAPRGNPGPAGPLGLMSAAAVVVVVLDLVLVPAFSSLGTPLWTYGYLHIVYEIFRYGGGLGASNPVWWMLVSLIGGLAAAVGLVVAIASHSRSGAAALVIGGLLVAIASGVSKLASPHVPMGPGVWGAVIGGSAVAFAGASLLVDHRGAGWTLSTISVLAAVGLAAAAFPVLHHSSQPPIDNAASQESPPTVAASPEATSPVSGFAPSSDTTETTTTYDTTTTALDPEASAAAQLQTIADSDQSQVEQLVNQWVPQLSSKKAGLVDPRDRWFPNVPYTNQLILRDFNNWQGEFGNVLLFDSSNYVSEIPGYWVTIVNQGYPDAQSVISWCQSQGLNDDDCGASLISHDVPSGNGTFVGW